MAIFHSIGKVATEIGIDGKSRNDSVIKLDKIWTFIFGNLSFIRLTFLLILDALT